MLTRNLLTHDEQSIYDEVVQEFNERYALDPCADALLLNAIAFEAAKTFTAQRAGRTDYVAMKLREIKSLLACLGIRRDQREAKMLAPGTPQSIIMAIIERSRGGDLRPVQQRDIIDITPRRELAEAKRDDDDSGDK
jgi:hypothetical protein